MFGVGRFPNVEIRKINSNDLTSESLEREPFVFNSSDTEDELMDEEIPDTIGNGTFYNELPSEVSLNIRGESGEERIPVHLFVYGVTRHHDMPNLNGLC